ncbi:SDR family oxidoreductase [Acidiphilium sp.]|uniref:SDR family NAD(P)-dependent oxidoreductase n=1 Tax=Acidiphilium sp. TaxID=527 RepID=UPI002BF1D659|nr:SDR family oxidoreductase [Acidiphilium sp.]HQT62834.1 SDR family oxidoreductase [Acidiphilium sp.]
MSETALVTGASGGIGADIARILAARGMNLVLTARSGDRLEALADEIAGGGRPRPHVVALDLAAADGPSRLVAALREAAIAPTILINNAGYGLMGAVAGLDRGEQLGIVDLNIRSLVELTTLLLPDLVAARGRIMNVASVAAFLPGPGMAVYYASKAFVLSFSDALAQELRAKGVTVTALCPGLTATGFQARAGMDGRLDKLSPTMDARSVAEAGVRGLLAGRRRVVPGALNRITTTLVPLLPRALLLPLVHGIQSRRHG